MKNSFTIENFLSKEELEQIILFYDQLPYSNEYSSHHAKRKLMHYHHEHMTFMKDIMEEKFKKYFPNHVISGATFTNWNQHVELHTDGWQPNEDKSSMLGHAVLIPLRIEPLHEKTSTIIFDQYLDGHSVTLKKWESDSKWNISEFVENSDPRILNKINDKFDKEFYTKYLKHIQYELLEGFSIDARHEWKIGNAIVWKRKHFHTSEEFNPKLSSKLHMIFFVNFKNI